MSYDLYFRRSPSAGPVPAEDFRRYFAQRPHYTLQNDGDVAFYGNEQTGVYFSFERGAREDEGDDEELAAFPPDDQGDAGVAFNLNYYRPHVFGLEAEPEVRAFVAHFGLSVDDPQIGGMGRDAYSTEGFLNGWNAGNMLGYRSVFGQGLAGTESPTSLPSAEIQRIWRWNFHTPALQAELGEDVFVPRIMCWQVDGRVVTFATWTDAIPVALPRVDLVVMVRVGLAKRRLWGLLPGKPELLVARWDELAGLVARAERRADPHTDGYHLLRDAALLSEAEAFVRACATPAPAALAVPIDAVLDEDLIAAARATPWRPEPPLG